MARLSRLSIAGCVHHVAQRGNNQQAIFADSVDYRYFLSLLSELAARHGVTVQAYALRENHFQLLLTPETDKSLTLLMQALGRQYVRYFNAKQKRSGTLWEGRYRSALVQPERYLLACMIDMDLGPVRDGLVAQPRDYPWTSHGHYVGLRDDKFISSHEAYWTLGNTPFERQHEYEARARAGIGDALHRKISDAAWHGWALGDAGYLADLQSKTSRRIQRLSAGRPKAGKAP